MKTPIHTDKAPQAIGTYSQAIRAGNTIYVSGQVPFNPETMELVKDFEQQVHQVFKNLRAIANAAGADLNDFVKLNVYMTDLSHFATVNKVMGEYISEPYPARAAVEVKGLPRGADVEIEGIIVLEQ